MWLDVFVSSQTAITFFCRLLSSRSTGFSEVIVVVGGCERVGGFNLPYTECYDPVTGEWKSLAKLPEFTKSEYAVCALRNDILVSGKTVVSAQCDQSAYFFYFFCCISKKLWLPHSSEEFKPQGCSVCVFPAI